MTLDELSRNDTFANSSEVEDARNALQKHHYDEARFSFEVINSGIKGTGDTTYQYGKIKIKNLDTSKERTYEPLTWGQEFKADLQNGFYK